MEDSIMIYEQDEKGKSHMNFKETNPGIWDHYNQIAIYKNKSLLSGCLRKAYKYKSKVESRKMVYAIGTDGFKQLDCLLTSEDGKRSMFYPEYIKFLDTFPGAKWYLLTSESGTVEHGDGGVLLLKFGSKVIVLAPLVYSDLTVLTEFNENDIQPERFEKLVKECENYLSEFDVTSSRLVEVLKKVIEA